MSHRESLKIIFIFCLLTSVQALCENDSTPKIKFRTEGLAETYFVYDFTSPKQEFRPAFYYNHHVNNQPGLNLALFRFAADYSRFKTSIGVMTGSYASANLADEPNWSQHMYEANISFQLLKNKQLWLQTGIFNSHIGFESAIAADCYTLTRSLAADNSPYYETGVKLNYKTKNEKWEYNLLLLNGWQQMPNFNRSFKPSLGFQMLYSYKKYTFNYSNYIGNEGTTGMPQWRFFNNFYLIAKPHKSVSLILALDVGLQYHTIKKNTAFWYTPQAVVKYRLTKALDLVGRIEHYADRNAVVTLPYKNAALNLLGASMNLDFKFFKSLMLRIEIKQLYNVDPIFINDQLLSRYNLSAATSLSVRF
jgi:hypothetical protein